MFWFIMRAIIRADRNERKVYANVEAEEREAASSSARQRSSRATAPSSR